jgi:hypothetical protein
VCPISIPGDFCFPKTKESHPVTDKSMSLPQAEKFPTPNNHYSANFGLSICKPKKGFEGKTDAVLILRRLFSGFLLLQFIEPAVVCVSSNQIFVSPFLNDLPVLQNQDSVGVLDGA